MGLFSDGERGLAIVASNAPEKKINYRSVGRGSGGVEMTARRRYSWRDPDFVSQPSIPGKFETVLYRGNNEDRGFGSAAPRFGQESRQSELPGPATNGPPPDLASRGMMDNAIGKRGHGAFSSRTPRQKPPVGALQAPGPGAYTAPERPPPVISDRVDILPSSAFVPPASVNPAKFNARPAPWPGDYSGAIGLHTGAKADSTGAYIPRESTCGGLVAKTATPGPGTYDARGRCVSAGPELSRRPLAPPKGWDTEKGITESALLRKSAMLLEAARPNAAPGPGEYDPKHEAVTGGGQTCFSTGESHTFKVGNSHKSRRWREQHPGPGQYETPLSPRRAPAAVASFASATTRFKAKVELAPGPAYYNPGTGIDTDFHLNQEQSWM